MYRVAAYSNVGSVKEFNQDSCCVEVAQTPRGDTALLAVCDGVGGLSSGEVASASIVRWLVSWYEHRFSKMLESSTLNTEELLDCVERDWKEGISLLNEALRLYGRRTNQRMGSTITSMLFVGGLYIIGHVGDCRAYAVTNGKLIQLTEDQTWVAREVARGTITPEQARSHPQRNVILQSVGTQDEIHPVFTRGKEAESGSSYFVCCDGFRNELFDDEMFSAFGFTDEASEEDMRKTMESLAHLAMERDERDNITAVCMHISDKTEYGDAIIECTEGVATIVGPEEEAPPTGFLYEPDNNSSAGQAPEKDKADKPKFTTVDVSNEEDFELISPAGPLALNTVIAGRHKIVKELPNDSVRSAWLVRDLQTHVLHTLLEVSAHSNGAAYSLSAQQLIDYAVIAQEAGIKTLWRVEEAYQAGDALLALCEHVEGNNLMQLMAQNKDGFAQADVVSWGVQLCYTVAALHSLRPTVLCCDVRPTSVILRPSGVLCIGHVQSMRRMGDQKADDRYLARGYSAPELFVDSTLADERSDVYALGATLFHLATGHSPLEYIRSFKLPPARDVQPEVNEGLEAIITKATKPDADERYQTVNSMLKALQRVDLELQEDDAVSAQTEGRAGE